jgi:hypothetical protein
MWRSTDRQERIQHQSNMWDYRRQSLLCVVQVVNNVLKWAILSRDSSRDLAMQSRDLLETFSRFSGLISKRSQEDLENAASIENASDLLILILTHSRSRLALKMNNMAAAVLLCDLCTRILRLWRAATPWAITFRRPDDDQSMNHMHCFSSISVSVFCC